jgi:putative nucleotidyltransferase with HDIG domain
MKTGNKFEQHVTLLAVLAAVWMYAWIGLAGVLAIGLPVCILTTLRLWSRWCAWRTAYIDTIITLVLNIYSPAERRHAGRVAELSAAIAREMGFSVRKIALVRAAGYLHDIGKHIKDDIVDDRWHVAKGADLVSRLPVIGETADWIRHHHTWHNGISCLASLATAKFPMEAAILAVAEYFDTATHGDFESDQPVNVLEDIRRRTGTQFHPEVVKAFLKVMLRQFSEFDSVSVSILGHQAL